MAASRVEMQKLIATFSDDGVITTLTYSEQFKLRSLESVLQAHNRLDIYEIKVVDLPGAQAFLFERCVLLVSREALRILTKEELQAIVAHEIGHEYFWDEWHAAFAGHNVALLRKIEFLCDEISAFTLVRNGLRSDRLITALRKLTAFNAPFFRGQQFPDEYPSLAERIAAINALSLRLGHDKSATQRHLN